MPGVEPDITVAIATIAPRAELLSKALASVAHQTLQPKTIIVEYDWNHDGAPQTKNRALAKVDTEFVAFFDDDDTMWPEHLAKLRAAMDTEAVDVVYSVPFIPQVSGGTDQAIYRSFLPFDESELRKRSFIQTSCLVRTRFAVEGGGFWRPEGSPYDDWGMYLGCLDVGAKFYHLPEFTFDWNHWGYGQRGTPGNTSGDANRW